MESLSLQSVICQIEFKKICKDITKIDNYVYIDGFQMHFKEHEIQYYIWGFRIDPPPSDSVESKRDDRATEGL